MAAQGFLARVSGKTRQIIGLVTSSGSGDAGKIPALNDSGKLDITLMPPGVGADTTTALATEAIAVGKFVNLFGDSGTLSVRLADNSNNRPAHGYVLEAIASAASGTVYPLGAANDQLSGLTVGADYWLGTAGGVISTPLDETDPNLQGSTCLSQLLGKAVSVTEMITVAESGVLL